MENTIFDHLYCPAWEWGESVLRGFVWAKYVCSILIAVELSSLFMASKKVSIDWLREIFFSFNSPSGDANPMRLKKRIV